MPPQGQPSPSQSTLHPSAIWATCWHYVRLLEGKCLGSETSPFHTQKSWKITFFWLNHALNVETVWRLRFQQVGYLDLHLLHHFNKIREKCNISLGEADLCDPSESSPPSKIPSAPPKLNPPFSEWVSCLIFLVARKSTQRSFPSRVRWKS